jgi:BirA family biotin operon repressor/biotin-[acetyl-CoA-carboxylase] ligase
MVYKRLERTLVQLETVDSTNSYAADLIKKTGVKEGHTVLSKNQLRGRGQRSTVWTSENEKNLTFSTIFFPGLDVKRSFYLSIVASLAVSKALQDLDLPTKIKWPNDILVKNKKICGILIENIISGNEVSSSIIGIGVNVNQELFNDLPDATSVIKEKEISVEPMDIFDQIYGYLDFYYNLLLESNFQLLKKRYYEQLYRKDESGNYMSQGVQFEAILEGIDELGRLQLKIGNERKSYDLKEIKFI